VFLQINTVDRENTNIYENLQIVRFHFFTDPLIFGLLQMSIGLLVFGLIVNKYKRITICSLSTIRNIWSGIRWAITKVILNYSLLPNPNHISDSYLTLIISVTILKLKYVQQTSFCLLSTFTEHWQPWPKYI
jgi:glucose uptake protein GlcU